MRRVRLSWLAGVVPALIGCHKYVPLATPTPTPGETIQFQINDKGRFELAERFGSGLESVEGRVTGIQDNQYAINVFRVAQLNGTSSLWSGELVRLNRDYVAQLRSRQIDKPRTALFAIGGAGLVAYFISSRGLFGGSAQSDTTVQLPGPARVKFALPLSIRW